MVAVVPRAFLIFKLSEKAGAQRSFLSLKPLLVDRRLLFLGVIVHILFGVIALLSLGVIVLSIEACRGNRERDISNSTIIPVDHPVRDGWIILQLPQVAGKEHWWSGKHKGSTGITGHFSVLRCHPYTVYFGIEIENRPPLEGIIASSFRLVRRALSISITLK